MKRALLMLALAAACGQAARAQTQASLGVGVGTVRFPGGTSFSSATFSPASSPGAWCTDGAGGGTIARGPLSPPRWAAARASDAYGSKAAGGASLRWFLSPAVALEASGGSYLPDPYQGLPRAGFLTAGV